MSNGVTILQNSNDNKNWCLKFYINKIKVHKNNKKNVKRNLHFLSNLRSYGSGFGTCMDKDFVFIFKTSRNYIVFSL